MNFGRSIVNSTDNSVKLIIRPVKSNYFNKRLNTVLNQKKISKWLEMRKQFWNCQSFTYPLAQIFFVLSGDKFSNVEVWDWRHISHNNSFFNALIQLEIGPDAQRKFDELVQSTIEPKYFAEMKGIVQWSQSVEPKT